MLLRTSPECVGLGSEPFARGLSGCPVRQLAIAAQPSPMLTSSTAFATGSIAPGR